MITAEVGVIRFTNPDPDWWQVMAIAHISS
jgi:hypothetical protein